MPFLARDLALADALAAFIVAKAYALAPAVEVVFVPEWHQVVELADLQLGLLPGLTPAVTPGQAGVAERAGPRDSWEIGLHIAQRLTPGDATQLRTLLTFADQLLLDLLPASGDPVELVDSNGDVWQCASATALRRFDPNAISRDKTTAGPRYAGDFHSICLTLWRPIT